jgi:hypothetical protein
VNDAHSNSLGKVYNLCAGQFVAHLLDPIKTRRSLFCRRSNAQEFRRLERMNPMLLKSFDISLDAISWSV